MKLLKVLTAAAVVTLTGFALTIAFADNATNTPPPAHHGPHGNGPLLEHLLPSHIVESLVLTAEQQTTFDGLEAAFKKDAAKWRADNPIDEAAVKQARETGDKEALRQLAEKRKGLLDIRKGYIDKLRASLTDEQKAKLDKAIEEMRTRQPRGQHTKPGTTTTPPPPAE